jgi:hypothetical protein
MQWAICVFFILYSVRSGRLGRLHHQHTLRHRPNVGRFGSDCRSDGGLPHDPSMREDRDMGIRRAVPYPLSLLKSLSGLGIGLAIEIATDDF